MTTPIGILIPNLLIVPITIFGVRRFLQYAGMVQLAGGIVGLNGE